MADLIDVSVLAEYGVEVASNEVAVVARLIRSASAAVIDAAGSPIISATTTLALPVFPGKMLRLPGLPISSVQSVTAQGVPVTGYVLVGAGLYRAAGWSDSGPTEVEVTYTHGLPSVPEDIAELVASMVIAGLYAFRIEGAEGFALNNGKISSMGIDDYKESYATGDSVEAVTPMTLPSKTRRWLASRFGGGAGTVVTL